MRSSLVPRLAHGKEQQYAQVHNPPFSCPSSSPRPPPLTQIGSSPLSCPILWLRYCLSWRQTAWI